MVQTANHLKVEGVENAMTVALIVVDEVLTAEMTAVMIVVSTIAKKVVLKRNVLMTVVVVN